MTDLGKRAIQNMEERSAEPVDMFAELVALDELLEAGGFAPMSPFWRRLMKSFLSAKEFAEFVRWLIGEIARRGGKGLMSAKLACLFALKCPLVNLAPGERAFVELLSVDKNEAGTRLRMIEAAFGILGVPYHRAGDELHLDDPARPVTIRVRAASIRAVGGTAILIILDEVSRWRDAATGVNPAREIFNSIKAELLSQPYGRGVMFSAPYGENDLFAEKVDEGDNEYQIVARAIPTWVANPSITEAQTRALESNPFIWEREYAARRSAHVTAIASKAEIAARVTTGVQRRPKAPGARYLGTMDPSGLKNDAWVCAVWCIALRAAPTGLIQTVVQQVATVRFAPTFWSKPTFDGCIADSLALFHEYGVTAVRSDAHFFEAIRPRFAEAGVTLVQTKQTSAAITQRVEALQARISNGTIELIDDEVQTKELGSAQLVTSAARKVLRAPERKGMHDDTVSTILLAMEDGDDDSPSVVKLPPTESDVVIQRGSLNFEAGVGFTSTPTKYFARTPSGRLLERPPPYGSVHFVRWAIGYLQRGLVTAEIERWAEERGVAIQDALECPLLLDPNHEQRRLSEVRNRAPEVHEIGDANSIEARVSRLAPWKTKL